MAEREALRESLGLNEPVPLQFLRFVGNAAQGEFGLLPAGAPVADVIMAERLPATLELALICAALIALFARHAAGRLYRLRRDGWLSRAIMTLSLIGVSLPTFLIGILLILRLRGELKAGCPPSAAARWWIWGGGPPGS
jgi:peptide/nickel transport system permease protein